MQIGNVKIDGFVALAPMAGVADLSVRTISRQHGACYTVGEMTSAKGVAMGSEKSVELLTPDKEGPFAVQLFGTDIACMEKAAAMAAELKPDIIDINMGCPAPKITGGGAGSALLKNLPLAFELVKAAVRGAGDIPVTAKIRRGYEANDDVAVEAAKGLEQAGASAIAVHARTRAQMYAPPIDIHCITRVKQAVKVPVIGNGDIYTPQDAKSMFEITGCDLVMVGRGALGNPWLFEQINAIMLGKEIPDTPPLAQRLAAMKQEIEMLVADKGEYVGFREARKHVAWYMTGVKGAAQLRKMCGEITSWEKINEICQTAQSLNTQEIEL